MSALDASGEGYACPRAYLDDGLHLPRCDEHPDALATMTAAANDTVPGFWARLAAKRDAAIAADPGAEDARRVARRPRAKVEYEALVPLPVRVADRERKRHIRETSEGLQ